MKKYSFSRLVDKEIEIGIKLLDIDDNTLVLAKKIASNIEFIKAKPSRIAAVCIYLASLMNFNPIPLDEIVTAFSSKKLTIKKWRLYVYEKYYSKLARLKRSSI